MVFQGNNKGLFFKKKKIVIMSPPFFFLQSVILIEISQGLSLDILKSLLRLRGKWCLSEIFFLRMILLWSAVWCGSYFLWVLLAGWMYWGPRSLHALLESAVLLTFPTAALSAFFASAVLRPVHTEGERHETNSEAISLLLWWLNPQPLFLRFVWYVRWNWTHFLNWPFQKLLHFLIFLVRRCQLLIL